MTLACLKREKYYDEWLHASDVERWQFKYFVLVFVVFVVLVEPAGIAGKACSESSKI